MTSSGAAWPKSHGAASRRAPTSANGTVATMPAASSGLVSTGIGCARTRKCGRCAASSCGKEIGYAWLEDPEHHDLGDHDRRRLSPRMSELRYHILEPAPGMKSEQVGL